MMSWETGSFDRSRLNVFVASQFLDVRNRCTCVPYIHASFVTNSQDPNRRCWNLGEFQGPGIARCGSGYWRLIEQGHCIGYGSGCVHEDGQFIGLGSIFCTLEPYDGFMALEVGCARDDGDPRVWTDGLYIEWPSPTGCSQFRPFYICPGEGMAAYTTPILDK
jgi:hypothetical protein